MDIKMLKELIELDKKACKYMDGMKFDKQAYEKSLSNDKIKLYKNYMQRAENRIKKAQSMAIELEDEKRKLFEEKFIEMSKAIENNYENNKEAWVNELFERCTQ